MVTMHSVKLAFTSFFLHLIDPLISANCCWFVHCWVLPFHWLFTDSWFFVQITTWTVF